MKSLMRSSDLPYLKESITSAIYTISVIITVTNKEEKQTMTKYKEPRMPRKMKKRFKKLMKFYEEQKREYELLEKLNKEYSLGGYLAHLILGKCLELGIFPGDIENLNIANDLKSATITLRGSIKQAEITVEIKED